MTSALGSGGVAQSPAPHDQRRHREQKQENEDGEKQVILENGLKHSKLLCTHGPALSTPTAACGSRPESAEHFAPLNLATQAG